MRLRRSERGSALVELAIFAPLAVLLFALSTSVVNIVITYSRLSDTSAAAARYATRAAADPEQPGAYRLRPTAADVEGYVRRIATVHVESVSVTPDPSTAFPGTPITVVIRARAPAGMFGTGIGGFTLESITVMREE